MKVAIAGTGNVAQYLIEEFQAYGHEIVVLTRSHKPGKRSLQQTETDYSISSLVEALKDCEALVSTVADFQNPPVATKVQLDMLEACKQSETCKTFIPSEWTLNVEDYPEQPMFLAEANKTIHQAFKDETSVRWTIICNSWFADYVVPKQHRYLRDIGPIWPMDHVNKIFTIYGPGTQIIDMTSVRDVAKAVAVLLDSKEPWEPYTYISGDQLSWNDLYAIIKKRDPEWKCQTKSLADTVNQIIANDSADDVVVAHFELESYAGALELPKEKVKRDRVKHFQGLHFRTVAEVLDDTATRPSEIV